MKTIHFPAFYVLMAAVTPADPGPETSSDLILVQGGTFTMGDQFDEGNPDEKPVHEVTLGSFYMGKTEVTFEQYDAFCAATGHAKADDYDWGRGRRPVINVDWYDALEYCNWLSLQSNLTPVYQIDTSQEDPQNNHGGDDKRWLITVDWTANGFRLPTEAEWEYAAREGGKKLRFAHGKEVLDPAQVNFDASEDYKTDFSVVGQSPLTTISVDDLPESVNSLGLRHMVGNVYEWCFDWHSETYYSEMADGNAPKGPDSGRYRVIRGGCWGSLPKDCRTSYRNCRRADEAQGYVGFRVVRKA